MTLPLLHAPVESTNHGGGLLWGVAHDHRVALYAVLFLPLLVWPYVKWQERRARADKRRAQRFVAGLETASPPTKAAALLMLASAAMHAALVPHRLGDGSGTAALFIIDAVALAWLARKAIAGGRWRFPAIWLLIANLGAYFGYALAGTEALDEVGVTAKMVELAALAMILVPPRRGARLRFRRARRWANVGSFLLLTLLTGVTAWAALFVEQERVKTAFLESGEPAAGHGMVGMTMQPATWEDPTHAEQATADRLVAATRDGIARYADPAAAVAAGYKSGAPDLGGVVHYENEAFKQDGITLDPTRPEMLVYAVTDRGTYLIGAVYAVEWAWQEAPDAGGGSITSWHSHTNVCFGLAGLVGLVSPFGTCPAVSLNVATGPMMHVWIVDLPGGPYGLEPDEEDIEQWLDESGNSLASAT
jgi:hypothetical protein